MSPLNKILSLICLIYIFVYTSSVGAGGSKRSRNHEEEGQGEYMHLPGGSSSKPDESGSSSESDGMTYDKCLSGNFFWKQEPGNKGLNGYVADLYYRTLRFFGGSSSKPDESGSYFKPYESDSSSGIDERVPSSKPDDMTYDQCLDDVTHFFKKENTGKENFLYALKHYSRYFFRQQEPGNNGVHYYFGDLYFRSLSNFGPNEAFISTNKYCTQLHKEDKASIKNCIDDIDSVLPNLSKCGDSISFFRFFLEETLDGIYRDDLYQQDPSYKIRYEKFLEYYNYNYKSVETSELGNFLSVEEYCA